jgi:hypothetical protein
MQFLMTLLAEGPVQKAIFEFPSIILFDDLYNKSVRAKALEQNLEVLSSFRV